LTGIVFDDHEVRFIIMEGDGCDSIFLAQIFSYLLKLRMLKSFINMNRNISDIISHLLPLLPTLVS